MTGLAQRIDAEWDHLTARWSRQASSGPSQPEEQAMTTPQQPRLVDSLHAITGEIQANQLVARLLEHGLGKLLTAADTDHICGLVWSLEQPHQQAAMNVPQFTPHDDSAQFPADGQHQP